MVKQATPQSFQDRDYFPSFRNCPGEHAWDDRYLVEADSGNPESALTNKKHWCLLGEIIDANTMIRPEIVAKDYEGHEFVVAFYPDDRNDMPRLLKNFTVGNTIAIFYPLVHGFLDGTWGIRVEDSDEVIVRSPSANQRSSNHNLTFVDHTPQTFRSFRNEQGIHQVYCFRGQSAEVPQL